TENPKGFTLYGKHFREISRSFCGKFVHLNIKSSAEPYTGDYQKGLAKSNQASIIGICQPQRLLLGWVQADYFCCPRLNQYRNSRPHSMMHRWNTRSNTGWVFR